MSSGRRWLRRGIALGYAGVLAWFGAALALDRYGAAPPPVRRYAAIVVAGAGVMPGGVPGDALVARTRLAVELYRDGLAPRLALTGGVGDWGPAESAVARDLAIAWGVPADAIVTEDRSRSTAENAEQIAAVLGNVPILVVTDRYHALRCRRVFGRWFDEVEVAGAVSPPWIRFRGAIREVLAVAWYTCRGRSRRGTVLMLLWGTGALAAEPETLVALRVNGPRGDVLLQDEMALPAERVVTTPDGKHAVRVYVARMEDGRAVAEVIAGKAKDGQPKPKVQQSFELQPFRPKLQDVVAGKTKWSVEAILGSSWDPPDVTEAEAPPKARFVLAWDDAKLRKNLPPPEPTATPASKRAKPKPKTPPEDEVVVERTLDARDDPGSQASPMRIPDPPKADGTTGDGAAATAGEGDDAGSSGAAAEEDSGPVVKGPDGIRYIKLDTVPDASDAHHCALGQPAPAGEPQRYHVALGDLVPRLTSREVVGKFDDGTGYRVAAGVPLTREGGEDSDRYRVETGGLSFVIEASEKDVAFYYVPSTHFAPVADQPMSLNAGTVGATKLGEVTWSGDAPLPIQGMRGIAAPVATVRVPCAEVRLRPDPAMFTE